MINKDIIADDLLTFTRGWWTPAKGIFHKMAAYRLDLLLMA